MTTDEFLNSIDPKHMRSYQGKYSPKLTFDERCGILAAFKKGIGRRLLAATFDLDRRTVSHLYNSASPHYRRVREELKRLGDEEFIERYLTEDIMNKIKEASGDPAVQAAVALDDKHDVKIRRVPSERSNKYKGVTVIQPDQCDYTHRVEVQWVESHHGLGWYYKDWDGESPDEWMNSGPESIMTSKTCLDGAKRNVMDKWE